MNSSPGTQPSGTTASMVVVAEGSEAMASNPFDAEDSSAEVDSMMAAASSRAKFRVSVRLSLSGGFGRGTTSSKLWSSSSLLPSVPRSAFATASSGQPGACRASLRTLESAAASSFSSPALGLVAVEDAAAVGGALPSACAFRWLPMNPSRSVVGTGSDAWTAAVRAVSSLARVHCSTKCGGSVSGIPVRHNTFETSKTFWKGT